MKWNLNSALLLIAVCAFTVSGCLKDNAYDDGEIQATHSSGNDPKIIEIKLTAASSTNFLSFTVDNSDNDTTVDLIPVNLATPGPATQDIHVTLVQNDALVDDYNTENGTEYVIPTMYSVVDPVVVIPKGSHTGYLQIKFKPSDFVGTTSYAVGYSISKVDESGYTISGNNQNGIVAIGIKNKYDGLYALTMKTVGWGAYDIADGQTFTWPSSVILITSGANSVTLNTKETGSAAPAFDPAGGLAGFGATYIQFTFDPSTNLLTDVVNLVPPDSRNRAFQLNSNFADSRYDPDTKTIYAAFIMTQSGRVPQEFYDTLRFAGPR
jgi:hypothetical protein